HARDEYFLAPVLAAGQVTVYIMAILGLVLMIRGKQNTCVLLIVMSIAYFTLIPGVFSLCRFRIPVIPLYMIAAAVGIDYTIIKWKNIRKSS
ncbi:MAG: hypothetical protein KAU49_05650, partial [Candidatus Krumholzibacteria bacterium]|nr:hypothetical protein [Candidatus Krumholzibacteria bacterium]